MSSATGSIAQLSNYYPFGALRNDTHPTNFDGTKKFVGQRFDRPLQLSYLNARYYSGTNGQFVSEDPGNGNGDKYSISNQPML